MNSTSYRMSFTTGGLYRTEALKLTESFLRLGDWAKTGHAAQSHNLLQARAFSTAQRVIREVVYRLQRLSTEELHLLLEGDPQEQSALLWIAVCRRYPFIGEFATEVLRERFLSLQPDLNYEHYDAFFNRKSDWHPELEKLSQATRKKLRQVLFKILKEADLLVDGHLINPPLLSARLLDTLSPNTRHQDVSYFPIFDADLRKLA